MDRPVEGVGGGVPASASSHPHVKSVLDDVVFITHGIILLPKCSPLPDGPGRLRRSSTPPASIDPPPSPPPPLRTTGTPPSRDGPGTPRPSPIRPFARASRPSSEAGGRYDPGSKQAPSLHRASSHRHPPRRECRASSGPW